MFSAGRCREWILYPHLTLLPLPLPPVGEAEQGAGHPTSTSRKQAVLEFYQLGPSTEETKLAKVVQGGLLITNMLHPLPGVSTVR